MATVTVPVEEKKKKKVEQEALITGAEAIAIACKLANVDVVTAYPIRPYDTVMQFISQLKADGEMDCEYIVAEGEHSQFEIVKHASAVRRPRVLRLERRGLDVRHGSADRYPGPARAHGGHGRQPRPR